MHINITYRVRQILQAEPCTLDFQTPILYTVFFLPCVLLARSFILRDLPFIYLRINKDFFCVLQLSLNIIF